MKSAQLKVGQIARLLPGADRFRGNPLPPIMLLVAADTGAHPGSFPCADFLPVS
jgi:hypothetical protein